MISLAYYYDGNQGGFWIGYQGETKAIFDEFGGHTMRPLEFQRVADKYPYWVNVKGGQVPCNVRELHVCSNYLPQSWWGEKTKVNLDAIHRRISVVHWHKRVGECDVFECDEDPHVDFTRQAMYKFLEAKRREEYQPINRIV